MIAAALTAEMYDLDDFGCLKNVHDQGEEFLYALAPKLGIEVLSDTHWSVICFIRDFFDLTGRAPLIYPAPITCASSAWKWRSWKPCSPTATIAAWSNWRD